MKQTVFIASTTFDLIDVRAELEELIQEIGLTPLLSDSATSDFTVLRDKNSIETCLVNVRASNYFIAVLSQRYGPSLAGAGFPDLSATHLEYREAKENNLPVYFYVRDRLESDYRIWRSNDKPKSLNLLWVKQKDFRLFDLIEEHQGLRTSSPTSNWYQTFRNSVELKNLVRRNLRIPAGRAGLERAITENNIPIMQGISSINRESDTYILECKFRNFGRVPAFNLLTSWEKEKGKSAPPIPIVPPEHAFAMNIRVAKNHQGVPSGLPFQDMLIIKYQTPEGHWVTDQFHASAKRSGSAVNPTVIGELVLKDKRYRLSAELPFTIESEVKKEEWVSDKQND